MSNVFPDRETEFRVWLENFLTAANTYSATLGLSPDELTALTGKVDGFVLALNEAEAAKQTAKSKTAAKSAAMKDAGAAIRALNKEFRTNIAVTPEIYQALGLPVYKDPTPQEPRQPLDLLASGNGQGVVSVKFKRNGNPSYTTFVVETADAQIGPWEYLTTSTRTRFTLRGFVPGEVRYLRVLARINGLDSDPSELAVLYGSPAPLQLKTAA